jgi:hypothetical protein
MIKGCGLAIIALTFALHAPAQAEEIVVSNYGVTTNGMPFAVAMAKGFFKQQGRRRHRHSLFDGGGTTVRTMLGGNLAYGEINPTATVIAIQQGADLEDRERQCPDRRGIHLGGEAGFADQDRRGPEGKKIGYTNPRSTSQALAILVLEKGRAEAGRCRAGQDRRLRRGHRGARSRRGRHHADPGAALVAAQGQVPRRGARERPACRRSTTWSASRPARPRPRAATSSAR